MPYIVKDSAARMPSTCKGRYRHVAVMEVEPGTVPAMISARARGVRRIVQTWDKVNVGLTGRCAFKRALAEATRVADQMNAMDDYATDCVAQMGRE
ncbi:hypothetical protein UFOVP786_17 [uncultured Caudovirales phage]|uniref:Uncharacterized protein n=1 Tax=uncultured Caudovirales phage TaxID=2100421 RepID=A0A6J5NWH2_9CAUD|nr:hypothetical protein UFOVP786_17 [uncultured Caudovirales phage]